MAVPADSSARIKPLERLEEDRLDVFTDHVWARDSPRMQPTGRHSSRRRRQAAFNSGRTRLRLTVMRFAVSLTDPQTTTPHRHWPSPVALSRPSDLRSFITGRTSGEVIA